VRVVQFVAGRLAKGRPLALDPGWRFRVPGDDGLADDASARHLGSLSRGREETPVLFRWYDGLRLHLHLGNDLSVCLYVVGAFEPNEFVFLKGFLAPGMVVLDGGANEGLFTLFAARRVAPRGRVVAVEPSTREFERLESNIALNRLENVTTLKLALGQEAGRAWLAVTESRHAGMNALDRDSAGEGTAAWTASEEAVSVETVDQIVARRGLERLDVL
jgi:FkbM family methyltransferase